EDGIRDATVTGVQTCALPISAPSRPPRSAPLPGPALVTKNVMFGACGSCGAACCAGCCCASALETTQSDASASAATRVVFGLFMAVLPAEISSYQSASVNGGDFPDSPEARTGTDALYCKLSRMLIAGAIR